jgi:hypothetical protein
MDMYPFFGRERQEGKVFLAEPQLVFDDIRMQCE